MTQGALTKVVKLNLKNLSIDQDEFVAALSKSSLKGFFLGAHTDFQEKSSLESGSEEFSYESKELGLLSDCLNLYFSSDLSDQEISTYLCEQTGNKTNDFFKISTEDLSDYTTAWQKFFKSFDVPPCWTVLPEWEELCDQDRQTISIRIRPGQGFGTGSHSTTWLCLKFIGELKDLSSKHVLDFGAGSGMLAIAASALGAKVDAVEIDPESIQNMNDNIVLNKGILRDEISVSRTLLPNKKYDVIVANILLNTLKEFSTELISSLQLPGQLYLSGLLDGQDREIEACIREVCVDLGLKVSSFRRDKRQDPNQAASEVWFGLLFVIDSV